MVTLEQIRAKRAEWKAATTANDAAQALHAKLYFDLNAADKARDNTHSKLRRVEAELESLGAEFAKDDGEDAVQNHLDLKDDLKDDLKEKKELNLDDVPF